MPASDGASQPSNVGRVGPLPLRVAVSWIAAVAGRTGIPARALTAYANAQLATGAIQPGCHVSWAMLAGIGWVESGHGSHGGAVLRPDGTPSVPIVGPRLDGTNGTIAVRATPEGVRLDGDIDWDHAIGPMQFLPSTWIDWGVSADGGVPNPDDIDDAALTAANYLCANGHDLATVTGWGAALAAYNAPEAYATRVTDAAIGYARASLE
jgi:membrane-bound lytic murein transglycosylase B